MLFSFFEKFNKKTQQSGAGDNGITKPEHNLKNNKIVEKTEDPINKKLKEAQSPEDFLKLAAETNPQNKVRLDKWAPINKAKKVYTPEQIAAFNKKKFENMPPSTNKDACYVTGVADGDTFCGLWQGKEVWFRVKPVDTPEKGKDGHEDQAFAEKAKQRLAWLILKKTVYLTTYGIDNPKYNRVIADVFLDIGKTIDVLEILAKEGLAFPMEGAGENIKKAVRDASLNDRGIWGDSGTMNPQKWRKMHG